MAVKLVWFTIPLISIIIAGSLRVFLASSDQAPFIRPKVFIVGLSKTGTTSLGDALSRLGMKRSGWEDIRSRWLFHAWSIGNIDPLVSHTHRFDAFEDIPWAQVYREFADIYPSAKFVLSVRQDEERWLRSIEAHTERRLWHGHQVVYGCPRASECRQSYLEAYRKHNRQVIEFFESRNQSERLLTFTIDESTKGDDSGAAEETGGVDAKWESLIQFLGDAIPRQGQDDAEGLGRFPYTNSKTGLGNRDPLGIHWAIDRCFFFVEAGLIRLTGILSSVADSRHS